MTFDYDVSNRIGFILSEQYDFGSAKTINGLYGDLIRVTPFSKREQERYNRIWGIVICLFIMAGSLLPNIVGNRFTNKC